MLKYVSYLCLSKYQINYVKETSTRVKEQFQPKIVKLMKTATIKSRSNSDCLCLWVFLVIGIICGLLRVRT